MVGIVDVVIVADEGHLARHQHLVTDLDIDLAVELRTDVDVVTGPEERRAVQHRPVTDREVASPGHLR